MSRQRRCALGLGAQLVAEEFKRRGQLSVGRRCLATCNMSTVAEGNCTKNEIKVQGFASFVTEGRVISTAVCSGINLVP